MKLKEFRKSYGYPMKKMAAEFGVNFHTYKNWELGLRIPRKQAMQMIIRKTEGLVKVEDFYA